MTEQLLNTYIEALRQINILSRLDLLLLLPDGNVAANFSHYTQHKMIRTRRALAKQKFLDEILPQFLHVPEYVGTDTPVEMDGYFFYALSVTVAGVRLLLCLGPFYIDQLVTGMIEADLPHYGINEIPDAASLFCKLPGSDPACGTPDDSCFPDHGSVAPGGAPDGSHSSAHGSDIPGDTPDNGRSSAHGSVAPGGTPDDNCFPDHGSVAPGGAPDDGHSSVRSSVTPGGHGSHISAAGSADEKLELSELARQNPVAHIRHNARLEKLTRHAITSGDVEFMEHEMKHLHYMEAGHYQADADRLRRMKQIAMLVNTVSCRAAEDGGAPSVWIRSICAALSDQIEAQNDIAKLNELAKELPLLYCRKVRESKLDGYSPYVRRCIRWIHAHLREDITLKAAARQNGVSYEYMSRLINHECGCSFSELLHRIRCQAATDFLKYGASVGETAEKCGYKTSSQFCHAFQKQYGISPKKWQQEHS